MSKKFVGGLGGLGGGEEETPLNPDGKPNNFAMLRAAIAEKRKQQSMEKE